MFEIVVRSAFGEWIFVESFDDPNDALDALRDYQESDPLSFYRIRKSNEEVIR